MGKRFKRVLVTGGAGYVGSSLVPKLLNAGYEVAVLDLYIYGDVFTDLRDNSKLSQLKGDLRNPGDVRKALIGCDAVIHLACISNDPSFDLNPELGRSINYRLLPTTRESQQGRRRQTLHLRLIIIGLRDQERDWTLPRICRW